MFSDADSSGFTSAVPRGTPHAPEQMPWPAAVDEKPSLLLIGGADHRPDLVAMAGGADFRLIGAIALEEAEERLGLIVAVDALVMDVRGTAQHGSADAAIRALQAWPGLTDAKLIILSDLAVLDTAVAALGRADAMHLCEPGLADIATALCITARAPRHLATLHDVGRDAESARLDRLSDEVRRLAQTIDRLTQGNGQGDAGRLNDMQPAYVMTPASFGEAPVRRPAGRQGTGAAISREEVRGLLQARRLRDRYLPPDLFADPAWDMMLDLMAARLAGKRVSVSSLCIAAAVPPTTALRWIGQLTDRGIFVRTNDPDDARRVFISLSDEAAESIIAWFAASRRAGLRFGG